MSLETTTSKIQYNGNGSQTAFPTGFKFLADEDLTVILTDVGGVATVQTITTHYTVTGAGNPAGGTVTMLIAPASGEQLTILRELDIKQSTDYQNVGKLDLETLESDLDKRTMVEQQLDEENSRSIKLPKDTALGDPVLPPPAANKLLGWNSAATDLENKDNIPAATPVTLNAADLGKVLLADATGLGIMAAGLRLNAADDTGAADAYVVALTPVLTTHVKYDVVVFKAVNPNTGPSTLKVNALPAKSLKTADALDPKANDILAGMIVVAVFDGVNFVLVGRFQVLNSPTFSTGGTETHKPMGAIEANSTAVVQSGTTGVLMTYTVPLDTLDINNKILRVSAWGRKTGGNATALIQFRFGSTPTGRVLRTVTSNALFWRLNVTLIRISATACDVYIDGLDDKAAATVFFDPSTTDIDLEAAQILDFNVSSIHASDVITQEGMLVELIN